MKIEHDVYMLTKQENELIKIQIVVLKFTAISYERVKCLAHLAFYYFKMLNISTKDI